MFTIRAGGGGTLYRKREQTWRGKRDAPRPTYRPKQRTIKEPATKGTSENRLPVWTHLKSRRKTSIKTILACSFSSSLKLNILAISSRTCCFCRDVTYLQGKTRDNERDGVDLLSRFRLRKAKGRANNDEETRKPAKRTIVNRPNKLLTPGAG